MVRLARNESGCTFALPANRFDVVNADQRDDDISAWGCFQYNSAAWRRATKRAQKYPWLASPEEELSFPLKEYNAVWVKTMQALESSRPGQDPVEASEKSIRLWHMAPALVPKLHRRTALYGWSRAWQFVPDRYRLVINRKVRERV